MSPDEEVGGAVLTLLERAGWRYLAEPAPDMYRVLLLQICGGAYDPDADAAGPLFWEWVQAILDTFFEAEERAEICAELLDVLDPAGHPGCREFAATALAERRLRHLTAVLA